MPDAIAASISLMPKLLAIGDLHGASTALNTLLEFVKIRPDDTVITVGDYIDRGPDSRGVLERLCELQHSTNLIPLRGNHEIAMLAAFHSRQGLEDWLSIGGDTTLRSYGIQSPHGIPRDHVEFIESCRPWHQTEKHFFVHANAEPDRELDEQDDSPLFWQHVYFAPSRHQSGKTMICGHTPQRSGVPKNWGTAVCIDTGAGHGLWLTCLDVRAGHYWQADQAGRTRESDLEPSLDELGEDDDPWSADAC